MEEDVATEDLPHEVRLRPWWRRALLPAVAAVYGPFFVAAFTTWSFVSCTHCKLVWLKFVWVFPGMLPLMLARFLAQSMGLGGIRFSETTGAIMGGAVSVGLVFGVAWVAGKGRVAKWIVLVLALAFSAWGAFAAFHLVRA